MTSEQKVKIYERFLSRLSAARLTGSEERMKTLLNRLDDWHHTRGGGEHTDEEFEARINASIEGLLR